MAKTKSKIELILDIVNWDYRYHRALKGKLDTMLKRIADMNRELRFHQVLGIWKDKFECPDDQAINTSQKQLDIANNSR